MAALTEGGVEHRIPFHHLEWLLPLLEGSFLGQFAGVIVAPRGRLLRRGCGDRERCNPSRGGGE